VTSLESLAAAAGIRGVGFSITPERRSLTIGPAPSQNDPPDQRRSRAEGVAALSESAAVDRVVTCRPWKL
jgi:hypothetical protein